MERGSEASRHFLWPYLGDCRVRKGGAFRGANRSFCLSSILSKRSKRFFFFFSSFFLLCFFFTSCLRHVDSRSDVLLHRSELWFRELWHTQQRKYFRLENCLETQVRGIFLINCMKKKHVLYNSSINIHLMCYSFCNCKAECSFGTCWWEFSGVEIILIRIFFEGILKLNWWINRMWANLVYVDTWWDSWNFTHCEMKY